jgi:membrane-bound ClpP family serine protease
MHAWTVFVILIGITVLALAVFGIPFLSVQSQALIVFLVALLVVAGIGAWLIYASVRSQYFRVRTGKEALVGSRGVVVTDLKPKGEIRVMGEFWQAIAEGKSEILVGQDVQVMDMDGMFLIVRPFKEKA